MTKAVIAALAIASLFAFACSSSTSGDDNNASGDASDSTDDATKGGRDGSIDATLSLDASAIDASLPPLPPAFTQCTSCMQTTCEPEIAACDADEYCVQLLTCALESGCLQSDASSCVSQCASTLGLTPKQVAQETKLLENMATSCASCLAECPKPDGGTDAGH